jgi:lipopolysaccharide heptosyltransferase I
VTRILVVRLSALGDVIHTIPAVVAMRDALGVDIEWAVERPYADLVEVVAGVRAVRASIRKWGHALFSSRNDIRIFVSRIRGSDVAVDFQGLIKSALVARFSGASERYGFDRDAIREKLAASFINRHVPVDQSRHVVEWNMQLASAVARRELVMPTVDFAKFATRRADVSSAHGDRADETSAPLRGKIVVLPGAGKANKQWPPERFGEAIRRIGFPAMAVWGPNERELAERTGLELAPPTDLRQLAAVLRDAALVIGGDTGPLHLAAALGTRVVGLYGPTSVRRNGPFGQLERCVSAASMEAISVEAVAEKIKINLV